MKPERWNMLTIQDRAVFLDKAMNPSGRRDPRWGNLIDRMSNSRFEELTEIQKAVVQELKG